MNPILARFRIERERKGQLTALLFLFLLTQTALAQSNLRGRVVDVNDKPVGGATVLLRGGRQTQSTAAGSDGAFTFGGLSAGTYRLTISAVGLDNYVQSVPVDGTNALVLDVIRLREATNQLQTV